MKNLSTQNSFFISLLILALMASFTSCSDKEKIILSTDKSEITLSIENPKAEFNVISNGEWHIEADGLEPWYGVNMASTEWYTVEPMAGIKNATVTVTLKESASEIKTTTLIVKGKKNQVGVILKRK